MIQIEERHLRKLLGEAWEMGWQESGEGHNSEYINPGAEYNLDQNKTRAILKLMLSLFTDGITK